MSSRYLAAFRTAVRERLRDEDTDNLRFTDEDIYRAIEDTLREVSRKVPRIQRSTITITTASKEIDLSDCTLDSTENSNLVKDVLWIEDVEWEVSQTPRKYRHWNWLTENIIELDTYSTPAVDDEVYITWAGNHEVTSDTSTLPLILEDVVISGAVAHTLYNWGVEKENSVLDGGPGAAKRIADHGLLKWLSYQAALNRLKPVKQRIPRRWSG